MNRAAVALLVGGCGAAVPGPAWIGQSPDGAHRAEVLDVAQGQRLVLDGDEVGAWDAIAVTHVAWSARGLAVPVRTASGWHLWHAGELGPARLGIGEVHASEHGLVHAALGERGWEVLVDGVGGRIFESIRAGSIVHDEARVAYVARDADGEHAVVDGVIGAAYRRVERLGFSGKGEQVVYVAYDEEGARVVADGVAGTRYDAVHELALAPAEPRWAAIVEARGELWLLRDGVAEALPRGARDLALSADGTRVAWLVPTERGARVVVDGEPGSEHADVSRLGFVPVTNALLYVAQAADGARVVSEGAVGPRFDTVELVTSRAGHWGYAGHRQAGSALVLDGALSFRGEWCSAPQLAPVGEGWAYVIRRAGRRCVVTPSGSTEVPTPFVDTLVVDAEGAHWAIAVAHEGARELRVIVDGEDAEAFSIDELASALGVGGEGETAARALVRSVLARATRGP